MNTTLKPLLKSDDPASFKKETDDCLNAILEDTLKETGVPGAVASIVLDGQCASATIGKGVIDSDSQIRSEARFQMGCIIKVLTSLVALELVAEKHLDLEAPLSTYLPELNDTTRGSQIRVLHLLSHTGGYQGINIGIPEIAYSYSWEKFLTLLRTGIQLFEPGKVFNYEHTEYVVLGEIIRRITGKEIGELFAERIFSPLQIRIGSSRDDLGDPEQIVADHVYDTRAKRYVRTRRFDYCPFWTASLADISISMPDLAALGEQLLDGNRSSVFTSVTVDLMRRKMIDLPETIGSGSREKVPESFCLGLACYESGVYGHNGSTRGQTSALRIDPAKHLSVAVAMNSWRPDLRDRLINRIFDEIRGRVSREAPHRPGWKFTELVGNYVGALGMQIKVQEDSQKLICELVTPQSSQTLKIKVSCSASGDVQIESPLPYLTIGFFKEPISQDQCLMMGLNTYKKIL